MEVFLLTISIILSLVAISKGSDWVTDSLVPIARHLKTSRVSIGLALVSIVVSLPEILVAVDTGMSGHHDISLGVIFGSILANIGLMTGLNAMIRPLRVTRTMILRDGIMSIVIPILILAISQSGTITRLHGFAILLLFVPYLMNIYLQEKRAGVREEEKEKKEVTEELKMMDFALGRLPPSPMAFFIGAVLLFVGTWLFSKQLIYMEEVFSFNGIVIGLTLGAIVPSLPNILASYKATVRGMTDVSVSETIGSNIFTLLVTIGVLSMITPFTVSREWFIFDIPAMLIMSILLFIFMVTDQVVSRLEGSILFFIYITTVALQVLLIHG